MSEPYYPANAGDPIRAEHWNDMQRKARDEIRAHTHTGGADGKQLDERAISSSSRLTVKELTISENLKAGGATLGSLSVSKAGDTVANPAQLAIRSTGHLGGMLSLEKADGYRMLHVNNAGEVSIDRLTTTTTLNASDLVVSKNLTVSENVRVTKDLLAASATLGNLHVSRVGETVKNPAQLAIRPNGHQGGMLSVEKADGYRMVHVNNDGEVSIDRLTVTTSLAVKQGLTVPMTITLPNGVKQNENFELVRSMEVLRILRGSVNREGTTMPGSGFSVSKQSTQGNYLITFEKPFTGIPTVIAVQATNMNELGSYNSSPSTKDNAVVLGADRLQTLIRVGDGEGNGSWRNFHFIAIGL